MKGKLRYINELDGIRAIAAIMIVLFHSSQDLHTTNHLLLFVKKFATFGQTGVSLFFVLSGFLITRILISTKHLPHYFYNFYIRRTLRIFPLYYLFLAIWFFVLPYILDTPIPAFGEQIYFWTYLQNFALTFNWPANGPKHFWSLAVEEHFYMFWPFLVYICTPKILARLIGFLVIFALLVRILLEVSGYGSYYFTFGRIDELSIGGLLAIWEAKGKLKETHAKKFALAILLAIIPTLLIWFVFGGSHAQWIQIVKFNLLSFIYFCLVGFVVVARPDNWFSKFLKMKFFSFTGKISYGLYVYHPLCFLLTSHYFKNASPLLHFLTGVGSSYLIAYLSYILIESRFISLKKYFEYKTEAKKTADTELPAAQA